jgi:hypothetical protein
MVLSGQMGVEKNRPTDLIRCLAPHCCRGGVSGSSCPRRVAAGRSRMLPDEERCRARTRGCYYAGGSSGSAGPGMPVEPSWGRGQRPLRSAGAAGRLAGTQE